jgi:hypothetical protein
LGFVGAKFSLEQGVTLTRVLVLLATVQPLCLGFGGTMPISYIVWLRSIAAIGLIHLVFARAAPSEAATRKEPLTSERKVLQRQAPDTGLHVALPVPAPRFPNLLR